MDLEADILSESEVFYAAPAHKVFGADFAKNMSFTPWAARIFTKILAKVISENIDFSRQQDVVMIDRYTDRSIELLIDICGVTV